jgi:hypothetical protein
MPTEQHTSIGFFKKLRPESIEWFTEGQGYLLSSDFAIPSTLWRQQVHSLSLADGGGGRGLGRS